MSGRPVKWEASHDGWTSKIAITFAYPALPAVPTYAIDADAAAPLSDLDSLVDVLDEIDEELSNGSADPTSLQVATVGGRPVTLAPNAVGGPTIAIGVGGTAKPAALVLALRDELRAKLGYPGTVAP